MDQLERVGSGLDAVKLQAFVDQLPDRLVAPGRGLFQRAVPALAEGDGETAHDVCRCVYVYTHTRTFVSRTVAGDSCCDRSFKTVPKMVPGTIVRSYTGGGPCCCLPAPTSIRLMRTLPGSGARSEEHTSELQ